MRKAVILVVLILLTTVFIACGKDDPTGPEDQPGIIGDPTQAPEIWIVGLEEGDNIISGTANNVDTSQVKIVLWAKTDHWYVQPWISNPYTYIQGDGTWESWTHPWWRMLVLIVDSTYYPGAIRDYHPATDPGVLAWDEYPGPSLDRYMDFSGYSWRVKNADMAGPGPNYFSDSNENVWLDTSGLHLATDYRDNKWYCAEVILDHSLGYGIYTFQLATRVDSLDWNAVFAGFIYESGTREIDIEFSGLLASPNNAQYVIQPYYHSGNIVRFDMLAVQQSTHRFEWRPNNIVFYSWRGHTENPEADSLIFAWTYVGDDIPPPGGELMRFNLWLFGGNPPTSGQADEVIVRSFSYEP